MKIYSRISIRKIKLIGLLGAMLIGTSLLSGCAGMMHQLGYAPIQSLPSKACATTPVLITNLKENARHRQYQLPDGRYCSEVNYYEQAQLQKSQAA